MARLVFIVLAVAVLAVSGLASADTGAPLDTATEAASAAAPAFGPAASDDQIGTAEDEGSGSYHEEEVSEAPVGGPNTPDTYSATPTESLAHVVSAVQASAFAGFVALGASYFF